jgi:hypothetical protein
MDDMLFVRAISFFLYLISTKRSISIKEAPSNSKQTWITCYSKVIKQAYEAKLDAFSFPSHTSHGLQPLDVNYFRPFKFVFRKEINESMFRNNHKEPNKVTTASWANRAFN